eukprot:3445568-Rhodomonas_salina.1
MPPGFSSSWLPCACSTTGNTPPPAAPSLASTLFHLLRCPSQVYAEEMPSHRCRLPPQHGCGVPRFAPVRRPTLQPRFCAVESISSSLAPRTLLTESQYPFQLTLLIPHSNFPCSPFLLPILLIYHPTHRAVRVA